jgi:serine/threonine protein kinase
LSLAVNNKKVDLNKNNVQIWIKQMIDCVEELHNHGIFHNDLKLDQFFLGNDGILKLGDFNSITTEELTYDYLGVNELPTI